MPFRKLIRIATKGVVREEMYMPAHKRRRRRQSVHTAQSVLFVVVLHSTANSRFGSPSLGNEVGDDIEIGFAHHSVGHPLLDQGAPYSMGVAGSTYTIQTVDSNFDFVQRRTVGKGRPLLPCWVASIARFPDGLRSTPYYYCTSAHRIKKLSRMCVTRGEPYDDRLDYHV